MTSSEVSIDLYDKAEKISKTIGLENSVFYINIIPDLKNNPVVIPKLKDKKMMVTILLNKTRGDDETEKTLAHELGYSKFKKDHQNIYSILRILSYPLVYLKEKYHQKNPRIFFIYPPYFMYEFAANWEATKRGLRAKL